MKVIDKHFIEYQDEYGNHIIKEVESRNPLDVISNLDICSFRFFDEQVIEENEKTIRCNERINYSYNISRGRRITLTEAKRMCEAAMRFKGYQPIFKPATILAEIYTHEKTCKSAVTYEDQIVAGEITITFDEIINNNVKYIGNKCECAELIKKFEEELPGFQRQKA